MFGVDLPERAASRSARCCSARSGRSVERAAAVGIEKLLDLPAMEDPEPDRVDGPAHALPAGGVIRPIRRVYALLCCTMVRLSLEHGNCALSARAYGSFAALIEQRAAPSTKTPTDSRSSASTSRTSSTRRRCCRACTSCGRCSRRTGSSRSTKASSCIAQSIQFRAAERRPRARGLQRRAPLLAPAVARHAARRAARGRQRATLEMLHRISDAANREFLQPRLGSSTGCKASGATATRSALTSSTRRRTDRDHPGARQSLVRGRLVHDADDPALPRGGLRGGATSSREIAAGLQPFCAGFVTRAEHAMFFALAITALYPEADAESSAPSTTRKLAVDSRADAPLGCALCPENYRAHAAARRGRVRAVARRAHRSGRSLRPRDRGGARAALSSTSRRSPRSSRRASGSRDGKPDFARHLSRQGAATRTRRGAPPARRPISARSTASAPPAARRRP